MALEIEHKFLVHQPKTAWQSNIHKTEHIIQAYLNPNNNNNQQPTSKLAFRVRIIDQTSALLTLKASCSGTLRSEFEYPIPIADAQQLIDNFAVYSPINKYRHHIKEGDNDWIIDEFLDRLRPLIIAEIELQHPDQQFQQPQWLGEEVTHNPKYYNHTLSQIT